MTKVKKNKLALWTASLCAFGMVMGLVACAPQAATDGKADQKEESKTQKVEMPAADEFGVVVADSWKDIYPDQYKTYKENDANSPDSGKHNYLELYPALNTMYKGYAFAFGLRRGFQPRVYSLKSVKGDSSYHQEKERHRLYQVQDAAVHPYGERKGEASTRRSSTT